MTQFMVEGKTIFSYLNLLLCVLSQREKCTIFNSISVNNDWKILNGNFLVFSLYSVQVLASSFTTNNKEVDIKATKSIFHKNIIITFYMR